MICALTVRRLRPGSYDEFRRTWQPADDEWVEGWKQAYHLRNIRDENEIVSFGFFDGTFEDLLERSEAVDPDGRLREERQRRMAEFVESVGADSIYEVLETVEPPTRSA